MIRLSELDARRPRFAVAWIVLGILVSIGAGGWFFVRSGAFDIAADTPHSQPVYWLMQKVREYSIAVRASDPVPKDLDDGKRIASGAGQYAEMCATCHLAPGMKRTEISRGLYPRAPELRRGSSLTPVEEFWVIKHGIKMTGMPAWGPTHEDEVLWDLVAFLRKMPKLTAEQYQALVRSAPRTHDQMMQQKEEEGENQHVGHGAHK
ncbi:MAG: cytochrome c [Bradyrhizobium sp.]|jgi:mono/diheme cytochrome c family protein|uniref:c-type cytochrome n=1 Tax=Bradyrhizobium sp. TaxID=376 RepID=UPI001A2018B4|nr:cytochrome c [Bradyrhizobium sp.]MBJ7406431.1 cytochrome c [Bradyrhizobium sp.]